MRSWLLHARESFWFLPALFGIGAVAIALGLVEVDRILIDAGVTDIPLIADLSATGGRAILSAIGGTMLGVAATSFSITISVLATTSSAYGPRLVRNFMADRGNQLVLAVLTSTFLYALIVLRAVHTEADSSFAFVPVIAVSFAVLLAVGDVAVLVYFIHHIATSVQVTTLQQRVLTELETVIDLLYPGKPDSPTTALADDKSRHDRQGQPPTTVVVSHQTGYVGRVEITSLLSSAQRHHAVYRIVAHPGDYVLAGDTVIEVAGLRPELATDAWAAGVARLVVIGPARTPHQDLRFAVQQVTEIGVRGLASGTNDPYTAVAAIDALAGALSTLCARPRPSTDYHDSDGDTRVVCEWPAPESLIADCYLAIRTYGMDHPLVVQAALRLSQRLGTVASGATRAGLRIEVAALATAYTRSAPPAIDADQLLADFAELDRRLAAGI